MIATNGQQVEHKGQSCSPTILRKRKLMIKKKQQVYNECFLEQNKDPIGYLFCVCKEKVNKVKRRA